MSELIEAANKYKPTVREVPDADLGWMDLVQKFLTLREEIAERVWDQAAVIGQVYRKGGPSDMSHFARDCGISQRWAWRLLALNRTFGDEPFAKDLSPSAHIAIAEKIKDPDEAREVATEAAAGSWSRKRTDAELSQRKKTTGPRASGATAELENRTRPLRPLLEPHHSCPLCEGDGEVTETKLREYQAMVRYTGPRRMP